MLESVRLATIRCPDCDVEHQTAMPDDACLVFHECPACGVMLRPLPGDCCVFCSYGTEPCPSEKSRRMAAADAGHASRNSTEARSESGTSSRSIRSNPNRGK